MNEKYKLVCCHLKSLNFHYLESWVKECVDYYVSSNPAMSLEQLKHEVTQQWLLVNLKEIKVPCLPPDLSKLKNTILPSKYAVQVETIVDIGHSSYSQLQKVNKVSMENLEVTQIKEEKHNRCLWLGLSDGVQDIKGMEYKPIPSLQTQSELLPGFKIIIIGPVTCRKGVLLLAEENIKVCGGEVDTLVIPNSYENILARRIGGEENLNPNNQFSDPDPVPDSSRNEQPIEDFENDDFDELFERHFEMCGGNVETMNKDSNIIHENEFPDDNDLDDFIIDSPSKSTQSNHVSRNSIVSHQPYNIINNSEAGPSSGIKDSPFTNSRQTICSWAESRNSTASSNTKLLSSSRDNEMQMSYCSRNDEPSKETTQQRTNFQMDTQENRRQSETLNTFQKTQEVKNFVQTKLNLFPKKVVCKTVSHRPFVYLKQITDVVITKTTRWTVKAEILTLLTRLTLQDSKFSLQAKISDGSLAVNVHFSSDVLEHLLGFSACEVEEMKKHRNENSSVAFKLREAFQQAQQKLIALNCLMNIEFYPGADSPMVVGIEDIKMEHFYQLKARQ